MRRYIITYKTHNGQKKEIDVYAINYNEAEKETKARCGNNITILSMWRVKQ